MNIINAEIHTATNGIISSGFVEFEQGLITKIGEMKDYHGQSDAVDAKGALLLPGFIDAHCHLGMWEDGLGFEGDDGNEDTDPVTPHLQAVDAINPLDHCFEEAARNGITTVVTGPGSANPIGGQMAAIKTYGKRIDDMLLQAPVAIKMALGENPKGCYHGKNQTPSTRMATAAIIREQLQKAARYLADLEKSKSDPESDAPSYDAKCEALLPLLKNKVKAHIHAHRADDIFTAIRLAKEFQFDYVLIHCTEGHLIAQELAKERCKVVVGPILSDRSKPELRNATTANAAILEKAGVMFSLCTDHPVIPIQYLPLSAVICGADGLTREKALRAVTIDAARIIEQEDKIGSIEVGKHADFALYRRDPITNYERPLLVFVNGQQVK